LLLGYGADPNAMAKNDLTKYGALTALIAAAMYKGNAETVRELLAGGANIEARDMEGATALMQASTKGNVEVVKALLAGGADVNAKSSQGETSALMMAAGNGRLETTRVLLASGADVNAKAGKTALMLAAGALLDPPGGNTYISSGDPATNYNHDGVVRLLIQSGADPNTKTDKGETALMFAAINNRTTAVRSLLNAGAEIDTKDDVVGYTALMHAAERGHTETVKELIKAGADLNARNKNNDTALTLAEKSKQDVVVKLLEVAGAVH
jgi:ankyrin repeat protein